jgi:hypothetical protein
MSRKLLIRTELASEGTPPWAGIAFVHLIDSDELAEDLKRTYPEGRTLRERKHMAIIDFFTDELRQMQQARGGTVMAGRLALQRQLDDRMVRHSQSPASSTCSAMAGEPQIQQVGGGVVAPTDAVSAQQFVFSAADGRTMQSKTKRKMTLDEKTAYKETRRRGACSKCKRQKGKVCWCCLYR